ncbi:MAG: restriction modification system DNA specificity domain protein [bacterium P3]|nr:MAG: restriction modification system DNA specificity domain protein [bacterium P3]KWW38687.1 MAG: restriction modification system DNA specificity domain protein [bacterium F083]
MSEWKEYKLGEVVTWGNGKERPKDKGTIPVYGGNGVLDYTNRGNYDGETVIIGRVGAYCGSVYYTNQPIWVSDNALAAKPQNGNDAKFLYYFLRHLNLNGYAEGSTHPLVTQRLLNSIDVVIPSLDEQKRIAGVLSSLDDKIDLLHRENATLEALAETLFRHYFIEDPNSTCKEGKLGDYVFETIGGEWGKEAPEEEYNMPVRCLRGADVADLNDGLAQRTPLRYIKQSKYDKIEPHCGDIILEISGGTDTCSTGRVAYINDSVRQLFDYPIVFSNFCRLLRVKEEHTYFVYCYFHYLHKQGEFFNLENGSSGIHNLNYKAALYDDLGWPVPTDEKLVIEFGEKVKPYFDKINTNKKQILTLSAQRDTLLPRLMSSDVIVM